jgi:hypothetical protein
MSFISHFGSYIIVDLRNTQRKQHIFVRKGENSATNINLFAMNYTCNVNTHITMKFGSAAVYDGAAC